MERWGLAALPRPSQAQLPCCDQSLSTFLQVLLTVAGSCQGLTMRSGSRPWRAR